MKKRFFKFLCGIGIHNWEECGFVSINPIGGKCKRCKLVRQFCLWGYSYGYDENDLPEGHIRKI